MAQKTYTIVIVHSDSRQFSQSQLPLWHWRLVAANYEILASSENYSDSYACVRAAEKVATTLKLPIKYPTT